jgi:hypothetical protein
MASWKEYYATVNDSNLSPKDKSNKLRELTYKYKCKRCRGHFLEYLETRKIHTERDLRKYRPKLTTNFVKKNKYIK